MAVLEASALEAGYGSQLILKHFSCTIKKGLTGILGRNGCGKTTFFRVMTGTVVPRRGSVTYGDVDLLHMHPKIHARYLAYMEQSPQIPRGISVWDYLAMSGYARQGIFYRLSAADKTDVYNAAALFGLESTFFDGIAAHRSAGQQQLLAFFSALLQNTPILLLDEPSSALDYDHTHTLYRMLSAMGKEKLILAVIHDPMLALRYCNRILLLKDGRVAADVDTASDPICLQTALRHLYPTITVYENEQGFPCVTL